MLEDWLVALNIKQNTLLRENLEMLKCNSTRVESVIFLLSVLRFRIFLYCK